MRKLAGLDLNGWHDRVARNWSPHGEEDDEKSASEVIDAGLASAVIWPGREAKQAVGGPQAARAPHGRGGGWGRIGAIERRQTVASALATLMKGEDSRSTQALAAVVEALCPRADQAVLVVPDHPALDDAVQDRLLNALRHARVRMPYLLWRPVALCLAAIERGEVTEAGSRIGVVSHTAQGLQVQTLRLRSPASHPRVLAPERRTFGQSIAWPGGLAHLFDRARRLVFSANPEARNRIIANAAMPHALALGYRAPEEILRKANGNWLRLVPPAPEMTELPELPEDVVAAVRGCDAVIVDTPLVDQRREMLHQIFPEHIPLNRAAPEDAALGARCAAERLSHGIPVYFDFLPQISVLVLKGKEPEFVSLVPEGATVPANETYRTRTPPSFTWPKGRDVLEFYIKKEGSEGIRRWETRLDTGPTAVETVTLQLEQRPAQGLARIEVRSESWEQLARHPIRLDWTRLETDPRSEQAIIDSLKRPAPGFPDRMILPCDTCAWEGSDRVAGVLGVLRRTDLSGPHAFKELADHLSRGVVPDLAERTRFRPVDSDGKVPDGVDPAPLDEAIEAAALKLRQAVTRADPLSDNSLLQFLTWCFARCPDDIQDGLFDALQDTNHPWSRQKDGHTVRKGAERVLWQGLGRTLDDPARIKRAIKRVLSLPTPEIQMDQRACLAFLFSRKDATFEVLSRAQIDRTVVLSTRLLKQERGGKYTQPFAYSLLLAGGLLRYRAWEPYFLLPDEDPRAEMLDTNLSAIIADMDRKLRRGRDSGLKRKRDKTVEVRSFLRGEGGDPNLLRSIADDS